MLDLTAQTVITYCRIQDFRYESFIGIKQGVAPWMAVYNRIFMLRELLDRGFCGWAVYMDADSFVRDLAFDLRRYLAGNSAFCFIAAGGGSSTPWDINTGSFLIDLGDGDARQLVHSWSAEFTKHIPPEYLADPSAGWAKYPSDQDLIYSPLKPMLHRIKKEDGLINYADGKFISQAIRASFSSFEQRVAWIRAETLEVLKSSPASRLGSCPTCPSR
jgi:hypothetical protein